MTTVGGGRGKIPSQFSCYPVKEKSAHETGKRRDDKRQAAQPDGAPLQARKQKRCRAWDAGVRTAGGASGRHHTGAQGSLRLQRLTETTAPAGAESGC